ncbi:Myosin light chain kinase 2, skeletal/cardiac muscle [Plecturocebus cupreus]
MRAVLCPPDDCPPPPAPFPHRMVELRTGNVNSEFSMNSKEALGGGKFGAVCTCMEKATGLKLAAKVIKKQTPKDKVRGAQAAQNRERTLGVGTSFLPAPALLNPGPGIESVAVKMLNR